MQEKNRVLATAVMNAADRLGLSKSEVAKILAVPEINFDESDIEPASHAGQKAILLIRLHYAAHALLEDDEAALAWLNTSNRQFGSTPRAQLLSDIGLQSVVDYLEAHTSK
ncbi:DUF2384 domain-containing protein [Aliidiomarina halalkaliphila]|uniref:DUF2384 domain-containing protein n=1 Tax=Aliidiomarina halalkaliphila TaxID=2593535 RepID=A0A552X1Q5_9GAMM|nr:MbcA/ParS/Xre antitoxin family protein [Aliidiomarina halalkaliphila]TRW48915.1 DUF2384 domain-containing protein [Aliidiomarina halalkaliphila]